MSRRSSKTLYHDHYRLPFCILSATQWRNIRFALRNKCHWYQLGLEWNVIIILFKSSSINIDKRSRGDYCSRRRLQIFSSWRRLYAALLREPRKIRRSHLRLNMAREYTPNCVGRPVLISVGLSRNKLHPARATRRGRPATMTPAATMTRWDGRGASF